jgi:hypothetical protein
MAIEAARGVLSEDMFTALSKGGWISSPKKLDKLIRKVDVGVPVS